ncbi:hypothetical protein BT63DRAFT_47411 [Microthyrium microscopicum]|uniref:MARVEL domain-containing protein n=1 Tax=Microthyrium microscopicum TaxID=703497 RepID=A0A6A6U2Z4_9PEZI|nr:hypothetical protein BT63DRAFT_47411 [Microthyrium microscopicum]
MSATPPPPQYSKNIPQVTISRDRSDSTASAPLKSPRTARFAEATAVYSPIDAPKNPFKDPPTNHYAPQPQVSDLGFGFVNQRASAMTVEMEETDERYLAPMSAKPRIDLPLKSALKSPGAAPRNMDTILSPTFREEQVLEKSEQQTEVEQKKDIKSKVRVRWAKFIMRGVNFGCSLIVLSMLATTFSIFRATKSLPPRNNLPAWAPQTPVWPQIVLLSIACVSLVLCMFIFYQYWKGGHRRAEKVAVYYTTFTVAFFVFSIVMWFVGALVLNTAKNNNNGTDIWGWSCKENPRKHVFQDDVPYALICRLQNWSLICAIIEIVIEVITIIIYGITFYRYYSKRRLRKTMAARDRARSDLYLAQLKFQSAPNTPGLPGGLLSPRDGGWQPPQGYESYNQERQMEDGEAGYDEKFDNGRFVTINERKFTEPAPFALQAPPSKAPKANKSEASTPTEYVAPVAPGEVQYGEVAIPGAYGAR